MAERRARINIYVGPRETCDRNGLARLEAEGNWLFEEKKDGFWCLTTIVDGEITAMVSRTGLAFEGTEVAGLLGLKLPGSGSGRLVGELTADPVDSKKCGTRRLHLFDVLDWNGLDLRDLPQTERREALAMVINNLTLCTPPRDMPERDLIPIVEQRAFGAVVFFDEVIARGGEGIVAKRKDARCRAVNADGKIDAWVRAKKKRTIDYVVMSHGTAEKGTPNVDLGLYKRGKLTKVMTCLIPVEWRKVDPDKLVGQVVEAAGWEVWPSGALRHAQLNHRPGPRTDKLAVDCTYEAAMEA